MYHLCLRNRKAVEQETWQWRSPIVIKTAFFAWCMRDVHLHEETSNRSTVNLETCNYKSHVWWEKPFSLAQFSPEHVQMTTMFKYKYRGRKLTMRVFITTYLWFWKYVLEALTKLSNVTFSDMVTSGKVWNPEKAFGFSTVPDI